MKLCIIGAGAAGLCAAKHCLAQGIEIVVFEQTSNVGGTWFYTDSVGVDANGVPVHTSMYKGLKTNLPKELMSYEDFPYVYKEDSFITQQEVLTYIEHYAKKFQLLQHIKFSHKVLKIEPLPSKNWVVETCDLIKNQKRVGEFQGVLVCNGHYNDPHIPDFLGSETFTGRITHSYEYRDPVPFTGKRVLVVGSRTSAVDISKQLVKFAKTIYVSERTNSDANYEKGITRKSSIFGLANDNVIFHDGTSEQIDEILLCTGYNYNFPFLGPKSGVIVKSTSVYPLYKQILSVSRPNLGFIGIPSLVCPFPLFDIQVRFYLAALTGHFNLPSEAKMIESIKAEIVEKVKNKVTKFHQLGLEQEKYFDDLAATAQIRKVPSVIHKMYFKVRENRDSNCRYKIIDDENFVLCS